ncbi:hypothetical protein FA95DRAFT_1526309, partial [Auriscalpium vulgare]
MADTAQEPSNSAGKGNDIKDGSYGHPSDKIWMMYNTQADERDKRLVESWKGDTEGILIFSGLFSATVSAFIIESYKKLSADSGDATVALLTQLVNQGATTPNGTHANPVPVFKPSASAIRVNAMWFLSLLLTLTCALIAILVQQWARNYVQVSQKQKTPHKRARIRAFLFMGVETFHMSGAVETLPTILHASVFLFFVGLVDFMLSINKTVAYIMIGSIIMSMVVYLLSTLSPLVFPNSPYHTPLSGAVWFVVHAIGVGVLWSTRKVIILVAPLLTAAHSSWRIQLPPWEPCGPYKWELSVSDALGKCRKRLGMGTGLHMEEESSKASWSLDSYAIKWTTSNLDEAHDWQQFVEAINDFCLTLPEQHHQVLLRDFVISSKLPISQLMSYTCQNLTLFRTIPLKDQAHIVTKEILTQTFRVAWKILTSICTSETVIAAPDCMYEYGHQLWDLEKVFDNDRLHAMYRACVLALLICNALTLEKKA